MNLDCQFCSKSHKVIFPKFSNFVTQNCYEKNDLEKFSEMIENEMINGNWIEINCIFDIILNKKNWKSSFGLGSFLLWEYCINCKKIVKSEPNIPSLQKQKSYILNKFHEKIVAPKYKVKDFKEIDFNKEFDTLKFLGLYIDLVDENCSAIKNEYIGIKTDIMQKKLDDSELEAYQQNLKNNIEDYYKNSLTNYIFYRLHSLYENRMFFLLTTHLDNIPFENFKKVVGKELSFNTDDVSNLPQISRGQIAVLGVGTSFDGYDKMINDIIRSFGNKLYSIKYESRFSYFFQKIISVNKGMKVDFLYDEKFNGKWDLFLKNYQDKRNAMTHRLGTYDESSDELIQVIDLMKLYLQSVEIVLDIVISYANSGFKTKLSLNEIKAKFPTQLLDYFQRDFINNFYSDFDNHFKKSDNNQNSNNNSNNYNRKNYSKNSNFSKSFNRKSY